MTDRDSNLTGLTASSYKADWTRQGNPLLRPGLERLEQLVQLGDYLSKYAHCPLTHYFIESTESHLRFPVFQFLFSTRENPGDALVLKQKYNPEK